LQNELKQEPINGKKNTKTTSVVGVTMATDDVAEERKKYILMDVQVGRRS